MNNNQESMPEANTSVAHDKSVIKLNVKSILGTSLVVQWLRICLPMQEMWVRSLVRELRSHMPQSN